MIKSKVSFLKKNFRRLISNFEILEEDYDADHYNIVAVTILSAMNRELVLDARIQKIKT